VPPNSVEFADYFYIGKLNGLRTRKRCSWWFPQLSHFDSVKHSRLRNKAVSSKLPVHANA